MIGLPVDWVEETEAAQVAEMLAESPLAVEDSFRDALVIGRLSYDVPARSA